MKAALALWEIALFQVPHQMVWQIMGNNPSAYRQERNSISFLNRAVESCYVDVVNERSAHKSNHSFGSVTFTVVKQILLNVAKVNKITFLLLEF